MALQQPFIIFNSAWSTPDEQFELLKKLPVVHEFGDYHTVLENGTVLSTSEEHENYASNELRIKTRKRATVFNLTAKSYGLGHTRKTQNLNLSVCFLAVPDWQAAFLDAERFYLKLDYKVPFGPLVGPYCFNFASYIGSIYEDVLMCLMALKTLIMPGAKGHLKILPLGIGPYLKTRFGQNVGLILIPYYLLALQNACGVFINETWIETLEFVDFTKSMSPYMELKNVKIMTTSRDALDFTGCTAQPLVLAPCDSFLRIGSGEKNLASTILQNTNLEEERKKDFGFLPWPGAF